MRGIGNDPFYGTPSRTPHLYYSQSPSAYIRGIGDILVLAEPPPPISPIWV